MDSMEPYWKILNDYILKCRKAADVFTPIEELDQLAEHNDIIMLFRLSNNPALPDYLKEYVDVKIYFFTNKSKVVFT